MCSFFFSYKNLNFVGHLFDKAGSLKPLERIKADFNLQDNEQFYWQQIIHFLPKMWKKILLIRKDMQSTLLFWTIVLSETAKSIAFASYKDLYQLHIVIK